MNKIDGSTAGCEIELKSGRACEVQAIGRCATCERAFCLSHQGWDVGNIASQRVTYIDMCEPCSAVKRAADAKRKEEADAPREYIRSGAARAALLASGVPPVKIYYVQRRWEEKKGFFSGGGQYVTDARVISDAWILGEFRWEYNDGSSYGGTKVIKDCLTALLDIEKPLHNNGLARIQPYSGGYQILDGSYNIFLGDKEWASHTGMAWRGIAQAVKRLIEKSS